VTGAEPAGYLANAGLVTGAFYDSLTFCTAAIGSARAEGRLGALPRLLAMQAILAVRLPDWDIAMPAAEEARRLATEIGQPIWLATAETAIAMIAAFRDDPEATSAQPPVPSKRCGANSKTSFGCCGHSWLTRSSLALFQRDLPSGSAIRGAW
jgi:hypothetical protein